MKSKIIGLLTIISLMAILLASCNSNEEYKIGIIAPLSGGASIYGISTRDGALLAFEEINAANGVLGLPIKAVVYDCRNDPVEALNAYNRLVNNDKVVAFVGPTTSGTSSAVGDVARIERIPMILPSATAEIVTTFGDYVFRATFMNSYQGKAMAAFANEELKSVTAAILYDSAGEYSTTLAEHFKTAFESLGGTVLAYEAYTTGNVDFRTQLTNIKSINPDVLFLPDYYNVIALLASQAKAIGVESTLLGGDGWEGVLTAVDNPSILEGAFYASHFDTSDPNPTVQSFIQNYEKHFGSIPDSFAALSYDAALIMAAAIETSGSTDNEAVIEALKNTDFQGVTGRITFDKDGNSVKDIAVITFENQKPRLYMRFEP